MPAVKYSDQIEWSQLATLYSKASSWSLSSQQAFSCRPLFPRPRLSFCFQIPSPIQHLCEAAHSIYHLLSLPAPWHCSTEQSSLGSCPPFPASTPHFCQPSLFFALLVIISTVISVALVGIALAIECACVILWMFVFKARGVVCPCARERCSRFCTRAGIYTAGSRKVQEQKVLWQFL